MTASSSSLALHLPLLRRFARTLLGDQRAGDACVVATLESLVETPDLAGLGTNPRAALYKRFLETWRSWPSKTASSHPETPAEQHLLALTPKARQAFLLTSVEGFSTRDVAEILGTTEAEVTSLIDLAGREIANEVATGVLIIEDEPLIAMDLRDIVESIGHHVVGCAQTHREAIELSRRHRPGLVLADVQLADGSSGLEAVNEILATFDVPVIFVTAFPERLLTGERPEPTFLVAKPFEPGVVKSLVSQSLFFGTKAHLAHHS